MQSALESEKRAHKEVLDELARVTERAEHYEKRIRHLSEEAENTKRLLASMDVRVANRWNIGWQVGDD